MARGQAGRRAPLIALASCCLLMLALAGCRAAQPSTGVRDGVVRLPIPADPATLSFSRAHDKWSLVLTELIGDSLIGLDASLRPVPRIARKWQWSDDHRRLTFELRKDVLWHDGRRVTSADVVHTWKLLSGPESSSSAWTPGMAAASRVDAPDPWTVTVDYDEPYAPALGSWGVPLIPAHRPQDDPQLVGCGPWRFVSWDRGARIVLEANPGHYAAPRLRRLVFEIIPDRTTQFQALKTGELDMAGLTPSQVRAFRQDAGLNERLAMIEYRILYYFFIAWRDDGEGGLFHDPRTRQAMTMAIDRDGLTAIFDELCQTGATAFHPDSWAFDPAVEPWPFDPQAAGSLLAEMGWKDIDGDGILERDGKDFRFKLAYSLGSAEIERIATYVQQQLEAIGVQAVLDPSEWALFLERARKTRDYDALMMGWSLDVDPDAYDLFHSSQRAVGGANYTQLADPLVDSLIEEGRRSLDRQARREIYSRLQRRLHQLEPQTVLFYPMSPLAYDRRLENLETSPLGPLRFIPGASNWRWSAAGE
ncbi:MAG: ABC transporter substrate-binding protein [Acidobacteriota bacterium]|nr:ABC transporter substrate-binding protein [Acidobacteriota bacterium]MDQ7088026.1 ABC transporter substrate-binding protein [Acidobacteriota bacterium]